MPMLWRPPDRHRDVSTWARFAPLFDEGSLDRHIMIESTLLIAPQRRSCSPPVVRQRRRRLPDDHLRALPSAAVMLAAVQKSIMNPTRIAQLAQIQINSPFRSRR